jgi:hypothetical protein
MVQVSLPCLLFAEADGVGEDDKGAGRCPRRVGEVGTTLVLKGGTDADLAPPIDYLTKVFVPTMRRLFGLPSLEVRCVTV